MYIVSREGNCVTTISAGKARMSLCRLIDRVAETHEIIRISGKTTNAILVSEEKWNAIQETLYLYENPETHKSIKESMNTPLTECGRKLNW
ncbi:type II toxin-antitoxin system Phd/YefM family antitoxin [Polynucleobacter sp.]|jgi:antitoxin YefM|uniref:type II toxin-antitoxin system Phd/YefM family antitoxin n=1 Tax=Polynucleobacter sp. TaxID=2029855 RepID=UPI0027330024|nr:type II toxin-antitoxin system Phd/YefM family antitoxin [Polynucleobacter sp.]MDP3122757.1 type II toxin-antitoxin system Phd/YefM family antitoxin [Polynucleobacter sp.]